MEEKNPIQVAGRLFQTVELLAANGPTGLMELSSSLELNKSTVHRVLNSLIYMGYVKQDRDTLKYKLTLKIWKIANQAMGQTDIIDVARPYLKQLAAATGETVHLVQIDGEDAVYIDKVEAYQNSVRLVSQVGKNIPLYCSGVGKALLAEMDDMEIKKIWDNSDKKAYTPNTITEFKAFMKEITRIREKGYAMDNEENELGVRCIAAALKQEGGIPVYAFSISAPVTKMQSERVEELWGEILRVKEQLSKELFT